MRDADKAVKLISEGLDMLYELLPADPMMFMNIVNELLCEVGQKYETKERLMKEL